MASNEWSAEIGEHKGKSKRPHPPVDWSAGGQSSQQDQDQDQSEQPAAQGWGEAPESPRPSTPPAIGWGRGGEPPMPWPKSPSPIGWDDVPLPGAPVKRVFVQAGQPLRSNDKLRQQKEEKKPAQRREVDVNYEVPVKRPGKLSKAEYIRLQNKEQSKPAPSERIHVIHVIQDAPKRKPGQFFRSNDRQPKTPEQTIEEAPGSRAEQLDNARQVAPEPTKPTIQEAPESRSGQLNDRRVSTPELMLEVIEEALSSRAGQLTGRCAAPPEPTEPPSQGWAQSSPAACEDVQMANGYMPAEEEDVVMADLEGAQMADHKGAENAQIVDVEMAQMMDIEMIYEVDIEMVDFPSWDVPAELIPVFVVCPVFDREVEMTTADTEDRIKQPRSRQGGTAFGAPAPSNSFQGFNTGAQASNSAFQPAPSSGGFNFNMSQSNQPQAAFGQPNAASTPNNTNGSFSGSLFQVPSFGQNSGTGTANASGGSSVFNAPSSFNFGGNGSSSPFGGNNQSSNEQPAATSSNPFSFGASTSQAPAQTSFGSTSSSSFPSLFGQSSSTPQNLFGQQNTPAQSQAPAQSLFSTSTSTSTPNIFAQSMNAGGSTSQTQNGALTNSSALSDQTKAAADVTTSSSSPSLFATTPSSQGQSLFGKSTETSAPSQAASLFQSSAQNTTGGSLFNFGQKTESKPTLGSAAQGGSSLFNFGKPTASSDENKTRASASPAPEASVSQQPKSPSLFATTPQPSAPASNAEPPVKSSLFSAPASSASNLFKPASSTQPAASAAGSAQSTSLFSTPQTSAVGGSLFNFNKDPAVSDTSANSLFVPAKPASGNIFGSATPAIQANIPSEPVSKQPSLMPTPAKPTPAPPKVAQASSGFESAAPSNIFANTAKQQTAQMNHSTQAKIAANPPTNGQTPIPRPEAPEVRQPYQPVVLPMENIRVPEPPLHFNEKQRFQFHHVWKLKVLTEKLKADVKKITRSGGQVPAWLMENHTENCERIQETLLKRKAVDDELELERDAPLAKRRDTGSGKVIESLGGQNQQSTMGSTNSSSLFSMPSSESAASTPSFAFGSATRAQGATADKTQQTPKATAASEPSYPKLPEAAAQAPKAAGGSKEPPKFQMPMFESSGGAGGFLSQFGAKAKEAEAKAAKARKEEDYDSEEEDAEEWEKRDAEKRASEKAKYDAIAKNASLGFKLVSSDAPKESSTSIFTAKPAAASTQSKSLFGNTSTPAAPAAGKPLFGNASTSTPSKSLFGNASTGSSTPSATSSLFASVAQQKPLFSFTSTSDVKSGSDDSATSVLPAAKPLPAGFSFSGASSAASAGQPAAGTGAGSSLFGPTSNPISKGGLFDRVEKDADGNPVKDASSTESRSTGNIFSQSVDNTFKGDSSTPLKFAKTLPAGALAPASIASDTSRATTPGTGAEDTDNAAGDDDAPKDAQLDLSNTAAGEENEDVLAELRAKGSELVKDKDGKSSWQVRGVGTLKLLRNKETRKTRLLLRSSPSAKIVFNTQLLATTAYAPSGAKNNTIRLPVVTADGKIAQYIIMVKEASDAADLTAQMEANKSN